MYWLRKPQPYKWKQQQKAIRISSRWYSEISQCSFTNYWTISIPLVYLISEGGGADWASLSYLYDEWVSTRGELLARHVYEGVPDTQDGEWVLGVLTEGTHILPCNTHMHTPVSKYSGKKKARLITVYVASCLRGKRRLLQYLSNTHGKNWQPLN